LEAISQILVFLGAKKVESVELLLLHAYIRSLTEPNKWKCKGKGIQCQPILQAQYTLLMNEVLATESRKYYNCSTSGWKNANA